MVIKVGVVESFLLWLLLLYRDAWQWRSALLRGRLRDWRAMLLGYGTTLLRLRAA
jgi:hypothetical protein